MQLQRALPGAPSTHLWNWDNLGGKDAGGLHPSTCSGQFGCDLGVPSLAGLVQHPVVRYSCISVFLYYVYLFATPTQPRLQLQTSGCVLFLSGSVRRDILLRHPQPSQLGKLPPALAQLGQCQVLTCVTTTHVPIPAGHSSFLLGRELTPGAVQTWIGSASECVLAACTPQLGWDKLLSQFFTLRTS